MPYSKKYQWKKESVSDFVATADTDKSYNSKPANELPVWNKDDKSAGPSQSQSGSKIPQEKEIVVEFKDKK
ncbi:hypothetical protein ACHAPA_006399 [Fusarium lateritium]